MTFGCGVDYTNEVSSPSMQYDDWWDIPGTIYSVRQSTFNTCPCNECTPCPPADCVLMVYKNSRVNYVGAMTWCDGETSFDSGTICIDPTILFCYDYAYAEYTVRFNVCSTYNDVYVNSSTGKDGACGSVYDNPVKTFARAYALLNSGGTIHVINNGADFSGESVTLNKSFYVDLLGSAGYFYMPQGG